MSLPDVTPIVSYDGNGSTVTAYPFLFKVLDASHVKLYLDGVLSSDAITVTGVGDDAGVEVTTSVAYASEVKVTLLREVPFSQETDLVEGGRLREESLENALDFGVMQAQQLKEELGRAVKFPPGSAGSTLPSSVNSTIGQDENGDLVSRTAEEELDHLGVGASATAAAASAAAAANSEAAAGISETNAAASEDAAVAAQALSSATLLDLSTRAFPVVRIGKKLFEPNITSDVTINFPGGGSLTLKHSERPYSEPNAIYANGSGQDINYFIGNIIDIINGDVTDAETDEDYGLSLGYTNVSNPTPIPAWSAKLATSEGETVTGFADLTYYGSDQTEFTVPLPLEVKAGADLAPPENLPFVSHTQEQSLTDEQKEQARENIGVAESVAIRGPYTNFFEAVEDGVQIGDEWYDYSNQIFRGDFPVSKPITEYFAQFTNTATTLAKNQVSELYEHVIGLSYFSSIVNLHVLKHGQNAESGSQCYALIGEDVGGATGTPDQRGRTWTVSTEESLGATYSGNQTFVMWGELITTGYGSYPTLGGLENANSVDGRIVAALTGVNNVDVWLDSTSTGLTTTATTPPVNLGGQRFSLALVYDDAGGSVKLYINGILHDTVAYASSIADLEFVKLSDDMHYAGFMVVNDDLDAAEMLDLHEILQDTVFREPKKLLIEGDSISQILSGDITPNTGVEHWQVKAATRHLDFDFEVLDNDATSGETVSSMVANDIPGLLSSNPVPAGATNYWFSLLGGINDLGGFAPSPPADAADQVYTSLKSGWALARAAGYKVLAWTVTHSNSEYGQSTSNPIIDELNLLIKSDPSLYDALNDIEADFIEVAGSDYITDSTYFSDNVHPYTVEGQNVMADSLYKSIINR